MRSEGPSFEREAESVHGSIDIRRERFQAGSGLRIDPKNFRMAFVGKKGQSAKFQRYRLLGTNGGKYGANLIQLCRRDFSEKLQCEM